MHFISEIRYNPEAQCDDRYYRIKESYRDTTGRVKNFIMLNVGFMNPKLRPEDVRDIGRCLIFFSKNGTKDGLFGNTISDFNETVQTKAREYWSQMLEAGSIDRITKYEESSYEKSKQLINVNSIKHTDARDVGAEWVCMQAIKELRLDDFLSREGWNKDKIDTAISHLITRTIYTSSELRSIRIMAENSAVCEVVSGNKNWFPKFHNIYKVGNEFYHIKDKLEDYLCHQTDTLFNIDNKLILFDLTYTE